MLSGFDVFDAVGVTSGNNSFTAGSTAATIEVGGGSTTIQLSSAVTTVLITPQAGDIDLVGATASDVVLEFQGFGIALDSLQQLALAMAERGQPMGAEFTVDVDGSQIGGVQVVTADSTAGQSQTFDVFGEFAPGSHAVSVNYLNANNSLLLLETATLNGTTISGAPQVLSNVGSQGFTFLAPNAPGSVAVNPAPDTLVLNVSQDYLSANAQFTVAVDGVQVGGVQTTTAIHGAGQSQAFDITGSFTGQHTVSVDLLNAAASGGTAGTLYLGSATLDGAALSGSTLTLASDGVKSFTFSH